MLKGTCLSLKNKAGTLNTAHPRLWRPLTTSGRMMVAILSLIVVDKTDVTVALAYLLERDARLIAACRKTTPHIYRATSGVIMATEVIPERAEVYFINEKYVTNATAYVRRTSRKSPYYINVEGTILAPLGENVTLHGIFYEFLHNEYKRSFVEFHLNMCELTKDPWYTLLGKTLAARGFSCPAQAATYKFTNMVVSMTNFPYVWPFERVMLQGYAKFVATEEILIRARFYVAFKREIARGKL